VAEGPVHHRLISAQNKKTAGSKRSGCFFVVMRSISCTIQQTALGVNAAGSRKMVDGVLSCAGMDLLIQSHTGGKGHSQKTTQMNPNPYRLPSFLADRTAKICQRFLPVVRGRPLAGLFLGCHQAQ
jgi:hypothetical protein